MLNLKIFQKQYKMGKTFFYILFIIVNTSFVFAQIKKPQEPKAPFNYFSEDIVFKNEIDNISLSGTYTYPKTGKNFPAVILISGSGPQDRDSEMLGHKPFLIIADHLTNNGIAVLRVDDRGTGESEGIYNNTGLNGFVNDTKSALDYLRSRDDTNSKKIGLIGHSLGGVIAPIIASNTDVVTFIVMLAGSGIRGDQLMLLQKEQLERKMFVPEPAITIGQNNMRGVYDIILTSTSDKEKLQTDLKEKLNTIFGTMLPENQIDLLSQQLSFPWLTDFIKFDPKESLSKTKCPVLALNGSNDLQVPAKENLQAIKKILTKSGNDNFKTMEIENLNHLFQESETGLPAEYVTIEQTFSPKVLEIMTTWIKSKT